MSEDKKELKDEHKPEASTGPRSPVGASSPAAPDSHTQAVSTEGDGRGFASMTLVVTLVMTLLPTSKIGPEAVRKGLSERHDTA